MNQQQIDPMQRAKEAVSLAAQTAIGAAYAVACAGNINIADVMLGVARGVLEGIGKLVPVGENIDALPAQARKCLRAAEAGRRAINEELGRVIEVTSVVPLNGRH